MDVGIILTGERLVGCVAPRTAWLVKQRRGIANVSATYMFDQATCVFDPDAPASGPAAGSLFAP